MDFSYLSKIIDKRSDLSSVSIDLSAELQRLKDTLRKVVEEKKINIRPLAAENDRLAKKTRALEDKAKLVNQIIETELKEELTSCSKDISSLSKSLEENNLAFRAVDRINGIHACLESAQEHLRNMWFDESLNLLANCENMIEEYSDLKDVHILTHLSREVVLLHEKLMFDMCELWEKCIRIDVQSQSKEKHIKFSIAKNMSTEIKHVILAFAYEKNNTMLLRFFTKLKEAIFLPLILNESSVSTDTTEEIAVLIVIIDEQKGPPHYLHVFDRVIAVIQFIRTHLNVNIPSGVNGEDFLQTMGHSVAPEITSYLIKHSLSEAIPSLPNQLESFEDIVANAEKFQETLQKLGFLPEDSPSFIDDRHGTNFLFANKIYQSYLGRARTIMKNDLHNMKKSKEIIMPNWNVLPPPVVQTVKDHFSIPNKPFLMEIHHISKSAQDVLDLVDAIVVEMLKSEENRAIRLLYTVRNIFEMYSAVVPLQHRKLLGTIPQQVALLHNNCLHFAYRLLSLGCECRGEWPAGLRDHYHVFLDQASALRQLAVSSLESCVSNQRFQIIANISDSGLAKLRESPKLDPGAERSVRQSIRQLQLLRNVWVDILPESVYSNSVGFLIDEFTQWVVLQVTEAEDISAQTANELVNIFGIVKDRLPKLFNEPKEVHRLCRKWHRFCECVFVLGSTLDSFSDRWASGLGPLANAFTKREAQGLIRALFRNTERRAVVLSQIYNS